MRLENDKKRVARRFLKYFLSGDITIDDCV